MEFPYLDREVIAGKAHRMSERAFGELPLGRIDLEALLFDYLYEEYGVAFFNDRRLGRRDEQDVLGMTFPLKNEIYVDAELAQSGHRGRYRFTVAHEIGHWALHRPLFLEAVGADEEARIVTLERDVVTAAEGYRPEEWQANQFAIYLLLNERALASAFEARFEERPLVFDAEETGDAEDLRAFSRQVVQRDAPDLPSICDLFELSAEAAAIALEERGYVVEHDGGG